ncbi:hypothetical protein B0H21DRAFT_826787 [Amylocystis lapponica]|nr:hypothetical protein B0H21DRAFT_826787 [Amylocystis lapponica]
METLLGFVDQEHRERVGVLHWLRTLTNCVLELAHLKSHVSHLFRTEGAKRLLPIRPSRVHPLATSGKNETVSTELKDAITDFFAQLSQHPTDYHRGLKLVSEPVLAAWHTGWTDLSRLVETHWGTPLAKDPSTLGHDAALIDRPTPSNLKKVDYNSGAELVYLVLDARMLDCWRIHFKQEDLFSYFHDLAARKQLPAFDDLKTAARELYRAYSSFRGAARALLSVEDRANGVQSPWERTVPVGSPWSSSLVATEQIGKQADPPEGSSARDSLPMAARGEGLNGSREETSLAAEGMSVSQASSSNAKGPEVVQSVRTGDGDSTTNSSATAGLVARGSGPVPDAAVPLTNPFDGGSPAASSMNTSRGLKAKRAKSGKQGQVQTEPFKGDRVLSQSITFIRDGIISREFTYAMAEGNVGRVYEAMKIMLFTFAGSSHTKYTAYLLETICNLELESSPELRNAILDSLLVNLSGKPGHFAAGDLIQEYFNHLLQAIVERKGTEYSTHFVRDVVSRNLHHMARLQDDLKEGVGLTARSGRHHDPHQRSELRKLTDKYKTNEVHLRRPGRQVGADARDVDDYRRGFKSLSEGKLQKWVKESVYLRGASGTTADHTSTMLTTNDDNAEQSDDDDRAVQGHQDSDESDDADDDGDQPQAPGGPFHFTSMCLVDGELVVQTADLDAEADAFMNVLEQPEDGSGIDADVEGAGQGDCI